MTGAAFYIDVFSVQLESRPVVVEFAGFPFFESVTFFAVGHSVFFKLPVVHVFMALGAGLSNSNKIYLVWSLVFDMTCRTVLAGMRTLELITGQIVIEKVILPGGTLMAILTSLARVEFDVEVSFVDVVVTIYAFFANLSETPFSILQMALKTRRGGVCAV